MMDKKNGMFHVLAKLSLISAKKANGAASLFDFCQPGEPEDLAQKIMRIASKKKCD